MTTSNTYKFYLNGEWRKLFRRNNRNSISILTRSNGQVQAITRGVDEAIASAKEAQNHGLKLPYKIAQNTYINGLMSS